MFKRTNNILGKKSLLLQFHEDTKIKTMPKPALSYPKVWVKIYYKEYPRFPKIILPSPQYVKADLLQTIFNRRSIREYVSKSFSLQDISTLLYFSAGINDIKKDESTKRMYPSGGARYPLEIYPVILKPGKGINQGIYHYNVKNHSLEIISKEDINKTMQSAVGSINKKMVSESSLVFIITAVIARTQIKYGDHSYRIIMLEAGHLAQNMYLVANALKWGCCGMGGFIDDSIVNLIDLDEEKEIAIYLLALGQNH